MVPLLSTPLVTGAEGTDSRSLPGDTDKGDFPTTSLYPSAPRGQLVAYPYERASTSAPQIFQSLSACMKAKSPEK